MLKLDINLVFTVINLLIIYFILSKFLFKPVKNILAKRQEEIDKQYAEAEEAKTQAGALRQQYEACVKGIDEEKAAAVSKAREKADEEYGGGSQIGGSENCVRRQEKGTGRAGTQYQAGTGRDCRACHGSRGARGCLGTGTGRGQGTL